MKYSSTNLLFTILAAATLQVQAQGFLNNGGCASIRMGTSGSPGVIQALGCNGAGSSDVTLDLNLCLANTGGQLTGTKNGQFGASCDNFAYTPSGSFSADCSPAPGEEYQPSNTVDLNDYISYTLNNNEGLLTCFGLSQEY